jgi:poly-gamma-glutamate synthesis protein (capsule biosynthesis protein)
MIPPARKSQHAGRLLCAVIAIFASAFLSAGDYEPSVTIVLLGDVMLGRGVALAHASGGWDQTLQSLGPVLCSADLSLANLESPIDCGSPTIDDSRLLVAPSRSIDALTSAGVDLVSVANNHALDDGTRGVQCTQDALILHGIRDLDSASPVLFAVHGVRLAFLAADFTGEYFPQAIDDLKTQIQDLRSLGNLVVVSLHWGMEYQAGADSFQKNVAQALANAGAVILWGHHPHAIQETAWLGSTLVLYSLGNAVFDQWEPATSREGELAWVEVTRSGVRRYAVVKFSIDPRHGRTGSIAAATFRFSIAPLQPAK